MSAGQKCAGATVPMWALLIALCALATPGRTTRPDRPICPVSAYGAVPSGHHDCTRGVQAALDACRDGGTVIFDLPGAYLLAGAVAAGTVDINIPENVTLLASSRVRPRGPWDVRPPQW